MLILSIYILVELTIGNWDRWSETVAVKLPDTMSESVTFENMLSIRISKWLVLLVGCEI